MKHTLIALVIAGALSSSVQAGTTPESPLSGFPSLTNADPGISKTPVDPASKARKPAQPQPAAAPTKKAQSAPVQASVKPAPVQKSVPSPAAAAPRAAEKPVRFATSPAPAQPIAAAPPVPQIASLSSPASQVRPFVLSAAESVYLDEEAALKREVRLLELRAKAAELKRKIEGESAAVVDSVNTRPVGNPHPSVLDIPPPQPFRLISVWGEASNLSADLLMNGVRVPVSKGHQLPDGWVVTGVASDAVQLRRGRQAMVLKIGG